MASEASQPSPWLLGPAYGVASFASSAMHAVFVSYYVLLFVSVYAVPAWAFFVGEALFLLWNSLNDALFGWLFRHWSVRRRLDTLRWCGWAWAACFACLPLLPLPLGASAVGGLFFCLLLLLYDTFLSAALLIHASLLADVVTVAPLRVTANSWSAAFSALGSCSVFVANLCWDASDLASFRYFCFGTALCSIVAFEVSCAVLRHVAATPQKIAGVQSSVRLLESDWQQPDGVRGIISFTRDVGSSFWWWAACALLQVFNCHSNSNFLAPTAQRMLEGWPAASVSWLLSIAAVLPHLLVLMIAPVVRCFGLHAAITMLIVSKMFTAIMFGYVPMSVATVSLYLVANKAITECLCRHGTLVVASLVDDDSLKRPNQPSRSPLYLGALAFLSKPGQALAAMTGWAVLQASDVSSSLVKLVTAVPVVCGILQLVLWQFVSFSKRAAPAKDL